MCDIPTEFATGASMNTLGNMMNVHEALRSRRTVHRFRPEAVPDDVVGRALEAARWAPNHKLTNPWRFYWLGPKARVSIGQIAARLVEESSRTSRDEDPKIRAMCENAESKTQDSPVLIAVSSRRLDDDAFREREDFAATACAIQNMQLSFWADEVGAKWSTGAVTRDPRIYPILGADEAIERIVGFVKAGYPEHVPTVPRKELESVVSRLP